ncbi:SDR family oxidoreductase [Mycobacterium cookii]|nr:SDR family oxidoreductase [Mycobacterium cookii]
MSRRQQRLHERYGPCALVTGASSGIGREIARQLAASGLDLVLVARSAAPLHQLADELIAQHGIAIQVLPIDLASGDGVDELTTATTSTEIGLYVASAGFGTSGPFLDSTLDQERDMLRLNCEAVLATSLVFGRRFAARGRGGLVLLSSIVGFQGTPNAAHYAATKAYVQTLAEALHVELRAHGVDVLAAAPGPTHSGFADRASMTMSYALSPQDVAKGTLAALGRRPTALPGPLSRVLQYSLAPLPRRARVRIMGTVMAGMTADHQRTKAQIAGTTP